ncbi:MAG TPA: hypothetical protein VKQ30_05795 [Ktedonobacterales bacterium]|nr:hypothetical protein [Ktedonobacterales bacterium]
MFRMYPDELHLVAHPVGGYVASDACFERLRQHWQRQLQLDQRQRLGDAYDAYDASLDRSFPTATAA